MKTKYTAGAVRELISKQWESDLPDRVIDALRPFHGKPITTRILAKLPALPNGATWRLVRNYGWTALETSTYCKPEGYADKTSVNLILARSEASVPLDVEYVAGNVPMGGNSYGENCAYFSARRERNAKRLEAQNDQELCKKMADSLNRYAAAIEELNAAREEFDGLTEYGTPFNADRYTLEKLADPDRKATHKEKA